MFKSYNFKRIITFKFSFLIAINLESMNKMRFYKITFNINLFSPFNLNVKSNFRYKLPRTKKFSFW